MLSSHEPFPTLPTTDLDGARSFYEGLGFTADDDTVPYGGLLFRAGGGHFLVYASAFAGTNKATAMGFDVPGEDFDGIISALRAQGITFDTFDAEGMTWEGDVMVSGSMKNVWFHDPDGNILSVGTYR